MQQNNKDDNQRDELIEIILSQKRMDLRLSLKDGFLV